VGVVLLLLFAWAFYLLMKGRMVSPPTPTPALE